MAGFLTRWMIDCSLDDEPVSRDPRAWRASQQGGDYARELRELSQRLRDEAPNDLEWPEHHLRRRTLSAVRECYIRRQRRRHGGWSINATVSPRLITTLAACVLFAFSASLVIYQGGPELFDSVRNAFTQPPHVVKTDPGDASSSEMAGVLVADADLEENARDPEGDAHGMFGPGSPGNENEPARAGISETDSSRSTPPGDSP